MTTAALECPTQREPVRLTWEDRRAHVVIDPENAATILTSTDYILRAVMNQRRKDVSEQSELKFFQELLQQLTDWLDARSAVVRQGIVTTTDGCLRFVVVGKNAEYLEPLHDEAIALEIALHERHGRALEVLYIPGFADDDGVRAFIDPSTALSHCLGA